MDSDKTVIKTSFGDEFVYAQILLLSFVSAYFLTKIHKPRKFLSAFIGALIIFGTSGTQILHSFTPCVLTFLSFKLANFNKNVKLTVFLSVFGYLYFFRTCHLYFPNVFDQATPFANAVQLISSLRLVSLGFDYNADSICGFSDIVAYTYCFIGLFTGPFYRKCVFDDYCNNEVLDKIPVRNAVLNKLKLLPPTFIFYLALKLWFPLDYFRSEDFLSSNWIICCIFIQVPFAWVRYRFYSAWMAAESVGIVSRLGAYKSSRQPRSGLGPKCGESEPGQENDEYSFAVIENIDMVACEFDPSIRTSMRKWNTSVQWWLANYIYRVFEIK